MKSLWIILIALLCVQVTADAQETDDPLSEASGVIIYADPRLDLVLNSLKPRSMGGNAPNRGVIRSGRGFRVQIYNGNDREEANKIKLDFMRRFPGIRVYMTYIQPQYRVKVGDYRTRAEAGEMYRQLHSIYTPVIIVPDIIVINTFKDDQQSQGEGR